MQSVHNLISGAGVWRESFGSEMLAEVSTMKCIQTYLQPLAMNILSNANYIELL